MNPGDHQNTGAPKRSQNSTAPANEEPPDLPRFRPWRGVYLFVIACFVLWVVLLALLSRAFS